MIHHLSISAIEPAVVASAFAEIFDGVVIPFRPNEGSFMVFQLDDHGTEIEIHPADIRLHPEGRGFEKQPVPQGSPTHFAISVAASQDKIMAVAARHGWLCQRTQRAEFPLVELWIENRTLCELLPPDCAEKYLEVNREFKRKIALERNTPGQGKPA